MPKIAEVRAKDGRVAEISVPDDYTPEQAQAEGERILNQPSITDINPKAWAAAQSNGVTSNFLKGLGQGVGDIGVGVGQRFGKYTPQDIEQRRMQFAPTAATGAGGAGQFVGQALPGVAASLAVPTGGPLFNTITQGLLGMAQGAAQPTGEGENWLTNAYQQGIGGAAGGLVSGLISRGITPVPGVSRERIALAGRAEQAGYPASLGQITGSPWLQKAEAIAGKQPEQEAAKVAALNRITTSAIGMPAETKLFPGVLDAAYSANNAERTRLINSSVLNTTHPDYQSGLRDLLNYYTTRSPATQQDLQETLPYIRDLLNWGRMSSINGDVYANTRSDISALARKATGTKQHIYKMIEDTMDAAAPQNAAWAVNRSQYKTLQQIDKPGMINGNGDINGGALWSATQGQRGVNANNPLREAAQYAEAFPPQPAGQNMTPGLGNAAIYAGSNALTGAAGGSIGSYYYGARDPAEIAKAGALGAGMGMLGPRLIQAAGNNPILRQYLMRGVAGGMDFTPFLTRLSPFAALGEQRLQEQRAAEAAQQNQQ